MVVSDTGLITWTATEGVLTSGLFTVTVSDGEFLVNQEFEILVEAVNDAPVIVSISPTSVYLGDEYFYSIFIEDPDNNEFTISLEGEPEGMILFEGGSIAWTPEFVGDYGPILVTVSDGELSFTETFILTVEYNYTVANYGFSQGNNLISFYSIPPEGDGVDFIFGNLGSNLSYIFGQNSLATQQNGQWVGSLDTVEPDKGYWLNLDQSTPFTV